MKSQHKTTVPRTLLLVLLVGSLFSNSDAAAQKRGALRLDLDSDEPDLVTELRLDAERRAALRELVGESRWRRMREARYLLDRYENDPTTSLYEQRHEYREARRSLEKCALKAVAGLAERRLGVDKIDFRRDRKAAADRGTSFSLSPRFRLGSDPGLGFKLGLRTPSPIWSRLGVEIENRFESDELRFRLVYRGAKHSFELSHTANDRQSLRHHGDKDRVISLSVRLTM